MTHPVACVAARCLALAVGAAAVLPAGASSFASSASEGASASVGSSSTSIEKSSESSSTDNKVAAGDYTVVEVAQAGDTHPARAGMLRLRLQPVGGPAQAAPEGEFFLYLPLATYTQAGLAAGQVVTARQQAYGLEFRRGAAQPVFFVVLGDDWHRELQTRVVRL